MRAFRTAQIRPGAGTRGGHESQAPAWDWTGGTPGIRVTAAAQPDPATPSGPADLTKNMGHPRQIDTAAWAIPAVPRGPGRTAFHDRGGSGAAGDP
jgi:hypothetical protein